MTTCAEIIEGLPQRFNADAAGDWKTEIQFDISGEGGGKWVLKVDGGACTVEQGEIEEPVAKLMTDAETWVGINAGTVNPMQAFMMQQIKIEGNMGELMKLNNPQIFPKA